MDNSLHKHSLQPPRPHSTSMEHCKHTAVKELMRLSCFYTSSSSWTLRRQVGNSLATQHFIFPPLLCLCYYFSQTFTRSLCHERANHEDRLWRTMVSCLEPTHMGGCPGGSKKGLTPQICLVPTQGKNNQSISPSINTYAWE